jgi:hypothetical protein
MVIVRIVLQTLIVIYTSVGELTQSPERVVSNKQVVGVVCHRGNYRSSRSSGAAFSLCPLWGSPWQTLAMTNFPVFHDGHS